MAVYSNARSRERQNSHRRCENSTPEPEHLGQLSFYLEALDRDHRKPHESPSIGVLLCTSRNADVVEYALSRTLSPALVAEYQTRLPDRNLLQAKLEEFYAMLERDQEAGTRA